MKCGKDSCNGNLITEEGRCLQTGCHSSQTAYPCDKCNRLNFVNDNEPVLV